MTWAACSQSKVVAALRVLLRADRPNLTGAIVFLRPGMPFARIAEALAGVIDESPPALLAEDQSLNARASAVRELRERSKRLLLATPLLFRATPPLPSAVPSAAVLLV